MLVISVLVPISSIPFASRDPELRDWLIYGMFGCFMVAETSSGRKLSSAFVAFMLMIRLIIRGGIKGCSEAWVFMDVLQ